jgi:L-aminopeptidase/D-esterase-like protein
MENSFRIGHYTDKENITGCTIILCPPDTVASCHVSGSSPGSREIALLDPVRKMNTIHALLLTGGSAFGLNAAAGVMRYLEEKGIGYKTPFGVVPIVPAAVIYDLNIGSSKVRPNAENAYQACLNATSNLNQQGSIGAGTGATIGKWAGISKAMKGGLGICTIEFGEIMIHAVSVVNPVGDVIDSTGKIIAGAIDDDGKFIAEGNMTKRWHKTEMSISENTVLSVVLTNSKLNKLEANILSRRAQNGLARAIIPTSTSFDGDIIFSLASGQIKGEPDLIYELATEALRQAIISGVENAESLGNLPTVATIKEK